jgi:hypothetical protein
VGPVLYKIATDDDLTKDTFTTEPQRGCRLLSQGLMWTTFDAIGEITLTTKGKDSDPPPQLQQFQEMPRF